MKSVLDIPPPYNPKYLANIPHFVADSVGKKQMDFPAGIKACEAVDTSASRMLAGRIALHAAFYGSSDEAHQWLDTAEFQYKRVLTRGNVGHILLAHAHQGQFPIYRAFAENKRTPETTTLLPNTAQIAQAYETTLARVAANIHEGSRYLNQDDNPKSQIVNKIGLHLLLQYHAITALGDEEEWVPVLSEYGAHPITQAAPPYDTAILTSDSTNPEYRIKTLPYPPQRLDEVKEEQREFQDEQDAIVRFYTQRSLRLSKERTSASLIQQLSLVSKIDLPKTTREAVRARLKKNAERTMETVDMLYAARETPDTIYTL